MITVIYCDALIPTAYLGPAESDEVSRTTLYEAYSSMTLIYAKKTPINC
jgi:hypothetical protein